MLFSDETPIKHTCQVATSLYLPSWYVFIKVGVVEHVAHVCDLTGLEVETLGGAPGVHTARYAGEAHDTEANIDKLLAELADKDNRKARFRTAIALIVQQEEHLFEGILEGEIAPVRRGTDGFGYDPVFIPEGTGKTFAELGSDIKNRISHRALAVNQLIEYINHELSWTN